MLGNLCIRCFDQARDKSCQLRILPLMYLASSQLAPRDSKLDEIFLYEGKDIQELAASGLSLDACCSSLDACRLKLESLA